MYSINTIIITYMYSIHTIIITYMYSINTIIITYILSQYKSNKTVRMFYGKFDDEGDNPMNNRNIYI